MAAIQTRNLSKRYGDVVAVDSLSLSIDTGECYGFLGPNGAGKSTTINVLTGQQSPDSGTARVAGIDPVETPIEARKHVGILPEGGRPPSFLTVREYFEFAAATRGMESIEESVDRWAERLAFSEKLDTLCTDLSQGEKQKVLITQAFFHEPAVVFIDEPLTNLDPIIQRRVKEFFETYREAGNTLFLSTHFVNTAAEVCTQVGVINRGRLLEELRPRGMDGDRLLDRFFEIVDTEEAARAASESTVETATDR
ncbi:MAG: ABC transporter ATP-binding protein [Natronomonas sp.]